MRGKIIYDREGNRRYFVNGAEVTQEKFDVLFPSKPIGEIPGGHLPGCWPKLGMALAVHPKRRLEAMENAAQKGVPTEFTEEGDVVYRDRAHRKAYHHAYGFHDNEGGYGD